ncbi:hypothetical protein M2443_001391 [Parabacteroides sp. PH5-16]|nr:MULTISPECIES: hypothetical protein [unclassified Parabacteroides]MDH6326923.1 hypothetical protein [Parabacteroides sp. PH5-41]MDH6360668.1 hypothetical protein [Parabacteroides sp. PH5-16]MDH6376410.1 hypothetical protein [Parabacteroides sp. PH5-33]
MDKTRVTGKTAKKATTERYVKENSFSADQLIDAWSKGIQQGSGIPNMFNEAFSLLMSSTSIIVDFYNKNLTKADCSSLFMRVLPCKVNFIAAISKDLYFDDERSKPIYLASAKITQQNPAISISFMPYTDDKSINIASLNADDYVKIM